MTNTSKLSVMVGGPKPTGLGDFVAVANPAGVYSLNNSLGQPAYPWVYRRQDDTWGRLPDACAVDRYFETEDPIASAEWELLGKKQFVSGHGEMNLIAIWQMIGATYNAPYNEWDLGTFTADKDDALLKAEWMNKWNLRALDIAHDHGLKLCVGSFASGGPDLQLLPSLHPMLRKAKQYGGIWDGHEYGIEGALKTSPSSGALYYRQIHNALPEDCRIPIVISEFWWGNGVEPGNNEQAQIDDAIWYGGELLRDAYVLWASAFQLNEGGESDFPTPMLMKYAEAAATLSNSTPPPDPPPDQTPTPSGDMAACAAIVDGQLHVWSLGSDRIEPGYAVLKDGAHFAGGYGVALLFYNSLIYVTNSFADWFEITATGYIELDDDPRRTIPPIEPPVTEPFWVSWPVKSSEPPRITDKFNAPRSYANGKHEGIDCDAYDNSTGRNADIVAAQAGVVEYVLNRSGTGYGIHVVIRHPWGNQPDRYRTLYAHLSSAIVTVGQSVKLGDKLGVGGATGTGAIHLHFNVHDTQGLKGYIKETDCSAHWPDGVIDPETIMRFDKPPTPTGTAIFGVHCRANAGDLPPIEQTALQQIAVNVKGYKTMTGVSVSHYSAVFNGLHYDPAQALCRLFFTTAGMKKPTPAQFVDLMRAGINDAWAKGIRQFEYLNEVNLFQEWPQAWGGAADFVAWALQGISLMRSTWAGIQFVTPGLAPIADLAGIGQNTDTWIAAFQSGGLFAQCEYTGAHAYWRDRANMTTERDGLNFRRYYNATSKPLFITEAANNQPGSTDAQKGQECKDYIAYLRANDPRVERVYFYVFSSTTPNENDTRQTWVRNNAITDIVREVAKP